MTAVNAVPRAHRSRRATTLAAVLTILAAACEQRTTGSESPQLLAADVPASAQRVLEHQSISSPYEQCATTRQVEIADVVRTSGDHLFALDEQRGLSVFDLSDIDHPRRTGTSTVTGTPIGVFVRKDDVIFAMSDVDTGTGQRGSLLRVVDVRAPEAPVKRSEIALRGDIRDVHAVDDTFYVLRDGAGDGTSGSVDVALDSYRLVNGVLEPRGSMRVNGAAPSFAVGTTRLALARRVTADASEITIVDIGTEPEGAFLVGGGVRVHGAVAAGVEPSLDGEERRVRIVACAGSYCASTEPSVITVIDAVDPKSPIVASELTLPPARGMLVAAFDADRLYVSRDGGYSHADGTSEMRVVDLAKPRHLTISAPISVRGTISSFFPLQGHVIAIGSHGVVPSAIHVTLTEIDAAHVVTPRIIGATELGEDFTSTPAADNPMSAASNEEGTLLALPFTSFSSALRRNGTGVEIFGLSPTGPIRLGVVPEAGTTARALFFRGRLLTVSDRGVTTVDYARRTAGAGAAPMTKE